MPDIKNDINLKLSIIIVTYNSRNFIETSLHSIQAQDITDFELIIVDNGSYDETVSFIKDNYPQAVVIENQSNLGAAKARNQGIQVARGDWVLVLDCDTVLEKGFFCKAVEILLQAPHKLGMLQPKIFMTDKKRIYSAGVYLSPILKRFYDIGQGRCDFKKVDILGPCSAAAFYRKQMLEEIKDEKGYFDERFFFLIEDVDLAWRAQQKGWSAVYAPELQCVHRGNSSSCAKKYRQYLCWRNRKMLLNKMKLFGLERVISLLVYDAPRFLVLFLTNKYVRQHILKVIVR